MSEILKLIGGLLYEVAADGSKHDHVLIQEDDPSAKLQKVTINGLSGTQIVFLPDRGAYITDNSKKKIHVGMSPLFRKDASVTCNKACDAVIIREENGNLKVCYIDLKSGHSNGVGAQFRSTKAFIKYLAAVCECCHSKQLIIAQEKYVVLKLQQATKRVTRPAPSSSKPNSPDSPYVVEVMNNGKIPLSRMHI